MNNEVKELVAKATAASIAASKVVIETAKRTNTPVIVWEDGQIKRIPPDQLDPLLTQLNEKEPAGDDAPLTAVDGDEQQSLLDL